MEHLDSFISVAIMIVCFFYGGSFIHSDHRNRRYLVSIAAGISVAYIFVDLIPELNSAQNYFLEKHEVDYVPFQNLVVYLTALFGFLLFFGLENYIISKREADHAANKTHKDRDFVTGLYLYGFVVNNFLISYLIVYWGKSKLALLFYTFAMSVHLIALDYAAIKEFGTGFKNLKYLMAFALLAGWLTGIFTKFPEELENIVTGFIAGSIIINSIKDEFPKEGSNVSYKPFLISSIIYAVILMLSQEFL